MTSTEPTGTAVQRIGPALVIALASTIAGGLVAAASAHAPTESASWAAAYLVLVGGVGTLGLALGRGFLSPDRVERARLSGELVAWLAGNALVVVGTLAELTWLVDVGGVLLVVALALVALGVRGGRGPGWLQALFAALVTVLLVSIPVGLFLARLRG
ncbi:hypothetical protein [Intrasporangium sp.]|uniref:hypothetical protein n=1 Tax=Intrasporangium sp. TaxID=1925024 RepID=UPI003221B833